MPTHCSPSVGWSADWPAPEARGARLALTGWLTLARDVSAESQIASERALCCPNAAKSLPTRRVSLGVIAGETVQAHRNGPCRLSGSSLCKQEVTGSIPVGSIRSRERLAIVPARAERWGTHRGAVIRRG